MYYQLCIQKHSRSRSIWFTKMGFDQIKSVTLHAKSLEADKEYLTIPFTDTLSDQAWKIA